MGPSGTGWRSGKQTHSLRVRNFASVTQRLHHIDTRARGVALDLVIVCLCPFLGEHHGVTVSAPVGSTN